jgi:hypothetical protein
LAGPLVQSLRNFVSNKSASFGSVDAAGQQFVVSRVRMPDMCADGQLDSGCIEALSSGGSTDSTGVPLARVLGNGLSLLTRTRGKDFTNSPSKDRDVLVIQLLPPLRSTLASQPSRLSIRKALMFCHGESSRLHQDALALVSLPGAAETDNDRT